MIPVILSKRLQKRGGVYKKYLGVLSVVYALSQGMRIQAKRQFVYGCHMKEE